MRIAFAGVLFATILGCSTTRPAADTVLLNGKVFTADDARPWAQAVAIRGDRIVAVGTNREVRRLAGPSTKLIDAGGRVVVPGINDAHVHEPGGSAGVALAIAEDASLEDVLAAVRIGVATTPEGTWLTGELPPSLYGSPGLTRGVLDKIAPRHLVNLGTITGHAALLNSAAMTAWNVTEPSGWIQEYEYWKRERAEREKLADSVFVDAMRRFSDSAVRYGITSVQSMPMASLDRVVPLGQQSGSPLRWRWIEFEMGEVQETPRWPVKYVFDGVLLERGAALSKPYADRLRWSGTMNYSDAQIRRIVEIAARGDQPLLVHAIGDASLGKLIDAMKAVPADWPSRRVRVEHGDFISQYLDDAQRLGIVLVQNPTHLARPQVAIARLGPERMKGLMMLRTLAERGFPFALGSDGPINPWLNVMFATTHPRNPGEALTREQAVIAYTRGSAYAEFAERDKGTISAGKLADLAVLSKDIFTVATDDLPGTEAVLTMIGGKVVFVSPAMPIPYASCPGSQ